MILSSLGNILIILALFSSIALIYLSFRDYKKNNLFISRKVYFTATLQATLIIMSFITLISGFIISDFSMITVYENSHTEKPLIYKIAGSWGNHEGSLLLWILLMTIFMYLFLIFDRSKSKVYKLLTINVQNLLIFSFLIFLFFTSNPFDIISPLPNEGLGLNPILQDPALAIHPPLLYVGFVGSSIYFSAAIASLVTSVGGKTFSISIKKWVSFTWFFQTLGIVVGSIWAYYELGWGGFWFWDPVENASLLPWFCMTALLHSLKVLEKKEQLFSWVLILCLMTFLFTVVGTFLVRSGILNSVHTFENDPQRGIYILIILISATVAAIYIFLSKYEKTITFKSEFNQGTFIIANNWFMMFYLLTVFVGTVYPIFTEVITDTKISVGPPFYNTVIIPFVIIFLLLMAIGPKISWGKKIINIKKTAFIFLMSVLINVVLFLIFKINSVVSNLIFISSIFLIIYSFGDLMKSFKLNMSNAIPRTLSHFGFALLILFIGVNHNLSEEHDLNLKIGEVKKINNYEINFQSLEAQKNKNYDSLIGNFIIKNLEKNYIKNLNPEIRIYKNPETITYEASINSSIIKDHYLTMSNIQNSEFYNIKMQVKPFMIWIWFSVTVMSLGGLSRLLIKNEN